MTDPKLVGQAYRDPQDAKDLELGAMVRALVAYGHPVKVWPYATMTGVSLGLDAYSPEFRAETLDAALAAALESIKGKETK